MQYKLTAKFPTFGKVIGKFDLIDDGTPFDEDAFIAAAKAQMYDDAPFGFQITRGTDSASFIIYID